MSPSQNLSPSPSRFANSKMIQVSERRSDTWIIFELAKRLGLGDKFWDGDIEAAYAYELAPSGVTLEHLKSNPGGISLPTQFAYEKHGKKSAVNPPLSQQVLSG